METARDMCGMTGGVPGHREAWWWSGGVAEAVGSGRIGYGKWRKEDAEEAGMECGRSGRGARRVISSAREGRQKEWANDLNDSECQNEIFRRAGRMVKERRDIAGLSCVGGASGRVIVDDEGIEDCWRECMGRLVGGESEWDHGMSAEVEEGPADCQDGRGESSTEEDERAWSPGIVGAGGGDDAGHGRCWCPVGIGFM